MTTFETWLETNGSRLAMALDVRRDIICESVSNRMVTTYPMLCYNPERVDAQSFQQQTFRKSPQRFHNVLLAALRFRAMSVIEREYAWTWSILPRFGVTSQHLIAQVRWYFEAARIHVPSLNGDTPYLRQLEVQILHAIDQITQSTPASLNLGNSRNTSRGRRAFR
jgi:hypothetical protein